MDVYYAAEIDMQAVQVKLSALLLVMSMLLGRSPKILGGKGEASTRETINYFGRGKMHGELSEDIICSEKRTTVSFEEQIMSKVFIILQIFPLTAKATARLKQNETRSKTRRLLGAFWHCFLNKFPNFLMRKSKKNRSISKFLGRTGVIGCERALSADDVRSLLCHLSRFHQSRARINI